MKISSMNWLQVEEYLKRDDRCIVPVGSTEQHAYLSLSTDSILAEKISVEAAEPFGIPVFPVQPYGITPLFMDFPGTISLKAETLMSVMNDILESLNHHGFKRILIVNGHGGNSPVANFTTDWMKQHATTKVKFYNWWNAPRTWDQVKSIDTVALHASWMENFPWTRLENVQQPQYRKAMTDLEKLRSMTPADARKTLADGNFGGYFEKDDALMMQVWNVAVQETQEQLTSGWD